MESNQKTKKKFNKLWIMLIAVFLVAGVYAVVVWTHSIPVTATVNEAFVSSTLNLDFSGIVGNTVVKEVNIHNSADVPIVVNLAWVELTNLNGVVYTYSIPLTYEAQSGDNFIPVSFTYDNGSPVGEVTGTLTLTRGTA